MLNTSITGSRRFITHQWPLSRIKGAGALHGATVNDVVLAKIPVFARSLIDETKTVRGFWLFRWFTETPQDRLLAAINRTVQLVESGALRIPEGQPIKLEDFSEAVHLAEAPEHGGKPLLVFET
jgi:NADPH2:quinone reductase